MQPINPLSKAPKQASPANFQYVKRMLRNPAWRVLLPALLVGGTATQAQAQTAPAAGVCVATPAGTGTAASASWSSAMSLVSALAEPSCTEIWLQQGIYSQQTEPKGFIIARTLQLYGGFVGNESTFANRPSPLLSSQTVLDGENIRAVLYIDGTTTSGGPITGSTVLDGFSVANGKATQRLSNLGGPAGGGIFCKGTDAGHKCSPRMNQLVLSGNSAVIAGGALANDGGNGGESSPVITDSTFSNNSANYGGSIFNEGYASPSISDSTFSGSSALYFGGAIFNNGEHGNSSPVITNSTFNGNSASIGGAIYNDGLNGGSSRPTISNSTFSGNSASDKGGAVYNDGRNGTSSPTISNSTFSGNSAKEGGAIYSYILGSGTSRTTVNHSIFWGNTANNQTNHAQTVSTTQITFEGSVIEGDCSAATVGSGGSCTATITANPQLSSTLQYNGGFTQTLLPGVGSSAIDAYACTTPATDQRGVARPQGAKCDVGAVELVQYPLAVTLSGAGRVQVDIPPIGAGTAPACPTDDCSALAYFENQLVTLTASTANSAFTGWSGDACAGSTNTQCTVTLDTAKSITANFSTVTSGSGSTPGGTVDLGISDGGVNCTLNGAPSFVGAATSGTPAGYTFPYGQVGFKATNCTQGGTLTVTLTLPSTPTANNLKLFKHAGGNWISWPATFNGNTVTYTVTDSVDVSTAMTTGDSDATAGNITDPVLIAQPLAEVVLPTATPVPTLSQWALVVLSLLAAGLGMGVQRRRLNA